MRLIHNRFPRPLHNEEGQGMTEYLIITALIAVAAIAVFAYFGQTIRNQIAGLSDEVAGSSATTAMSNAVTSAGNAQTNAQQALKLGTYNKGGNSAVQTG
ncbi:MAG: pilus assembly protein [Acidithiobacillus sp.]